MSNSEVRSRNGGREVAGRNRLAWAASLAALLLLAACGPGAAQPEPSPSTTVESTGPSSSPGAGAPTALDAYRGMWHAYVEASRIPDPDYPDLARYAQGNALDVFVNGLTSMVEQGLVGVGDVVLNPQPTGARPDATPPQVDIEDCVDTSGSRLVKQDGSPYEDTPGGRRAARATAVQLSDDTWRVSEFGLFDVGTC